MNIDWTQIDTVLLDMDGTLLDLQYDNHFWLDYLPTQYAKKHNINQREALNKLKPVFRKHEGTLDWYCVDFWSNELELDIIQYKADIADKIAYRPGAQQFLAQCQEHISDIRLITNAHRKVLNLKNQHTKLNQYFSQMICSHELGAPKENPMFWQALQEMKTFDTEKTLFIDDSESVLDAANNYGIKHLLSIAEPDSTNARVTASKYPMLESFSKVLPRQK